MDRPYVHSGFEWFNKAKGQNCRGTFALMSYLALRSDIHSSATHPCRCSSACFLFPLLLSASLQQEQDVGWKLASFSPTSSLKGGYSGRPWNHDRWTDIPWSQWLMSIHHQHCGLERLMKYTQTMMQADGNRANRDGHGLDSGMWKWDWWL